MRYMTASCMMKKYPLENMLLELEKLNIMEDSRGNMNELERTKTHKVIKNGSCDICVDLRIKL